MKDEMPRERDDDNVAYQWALRGIGAVLDEVGCQFVRLIETADGFVVQSRQTIGDREPRVLHISHAQLARAERELGARRGQSESRLRQLLSEPRESYQDFFRALGWELDRLAACQIAIDELEQGVVVTYLAQQAAEGASWEKRLAVVEPGERDTLLAEARGRRGLRFLVPRI